MSLLEPTPKTYSIAVRNVSRNCTEEHLNEIFGHFGSIATPIHLDCIPQTSRLVAIITYGNLDDAKFAVQSMHRGVIDGIQLDVHLEM